MTLVLSCITKDYAIQVSDRRVSLSFYDSNLKKQYRIYNSRANKAVLFCNSISFGYCGLGYMTYKNGKGIERTDLWLVRILRESSYNNLTAAVNIVANKAEENLKNLYFRNPQDKMLSFTGVGWTRFSENEELKPFICKISNYHNKYNRIDYIRDDFTVQIYQLPKSKLYLFDVKGQENAILQSKLFRLLKVALESHLRGNANSTTIADYFCNVIRLVANKNNTVGKSLMVTILSKQSVGNPALRLPDGQPVFIPSFFYLPADSNRKIQYGPHLVCGSNSSTNFIVRPYSNKLVNKMKQLKTSKLGMKAIFETQIVEKHDPMYNSSYRYPDLPPSDSSEGYLHLNFKDENGNIQGGYSMLEELPNNKCLVEVYSSTETVEVMKNDPKYILVKTYK